jgi:hypothetical protein
VIKKDIDYQRASIRCCFVREFLGGVSAGESSLMRRTLAELLEAGLTQEEIITLIDSVKTELFKQ